MTVRSRVSVIPSQGCRKVAVNRRDREDGVVGEVNLDALRVGLRHVRDRLPRDLLRDVRQVSAFWTEA